MVANVTIEMVPAEAPTRARFAVLGWLCAGAMLAYLHRFCISVNANVYAARREPRTPGISKIRLDAIHSTFFTFPSSSFWTFRSVATAFSNSSGRKICL